MLTKKSVSTPPALHYCFPTNEAQWKTEARCFLDDPYTISKYADMCKLHLLAQLVELSEVKDITWTDMVEVKTIYNNINKWTDEAIEEKPDKE